MFRVLYVFCFFFFKQKTAYEMRISDWSSDVCSSDLARVPLRVVGVLQPKGQSGWGGDADDVIMVPLESARRRLSGTVGLSADGVQQISVGVGRARDLARAEQALGELLRQRPQIAPGGEDDFTTRGPKCPRLNSSH